MRVDLEAGVLEPGRGRLQKTPVLEHASAQRDAAQVGPLPDPRTGVGDNRSQRRMEARGEIRGGRFVNGFLGEQFALPVAADSLRASRSQQPSQEIVRIAAADPLNLVGIILPGERIAANSGRWVDLRDGVVAETALTPLENLRNARAG